MKIFLIIILTTLLITNIISQNNLTCTCCQEQYRQFDFWLGDWEVYNKKGVKVT